MLRNLGDGQVLRDQSHTQPLAAHNHHRLALGGGTEELRVSRETERLALHHLLVEGCRYHRIERTCFQVGRGTFQRLDGCLACLFRGFSGFDDVGLSTDDEVVLAGTSLASRIYGLEVDVLALGKEFAVVAHGIRSTIHHGGAEFQHARIGQGFQDNLPADAVRVTLCDAYFESLF